ncbi:ATPase, T2SS/T4P/T4SS family [Gottfriedia solisilvae]|uniref:ATPase, T2SS/T4P/T4SS family n=1 Tax=Gottfriedia solisilvae TaxID=1516104 RepID=UPI003D2F4311
MNQYVSPEKRRVFNVQELTLQQTNSKNSYKDKTERFYEACKETREYILSRYDSNVESRNKENSYTKIYHEACIGVPEAVSMLKKDIEEFIRSKGYHELEYPEYYLNLVEGIYEELYGLGPLASWRYLEDSESAQVLGTEISFKKADGWELQPFSFRSEKDVEELCGRLTNIDPKNLLNEYTNPDLQTYTHDGYRVTIVMPKLMARETVISFRKQTLKQFNFGVIAKHNTIPKEAITLFEQLSKLTLTGIVGGPPGVGKSAFLQAMINTFIYERREKNIIPERSGKTIYAEASFEWDVRKLYPKSGIAHMIGEGEDFVKKIGSRILTLDAKRVILGEIKEHEAGLYYRAGIQGIKQVLGTLHDIDPYNIIEILSNLFLIYHNNIQVNPSKVYSTIARNLHFSISMDEHKINGFDEKKVESVQFYDVDHDGNVKMYKIMQYDISNDSWTFSSKIPKRIERLAKYKHEEFKLFMECLVLLENKYPMAEEDRVESRSQVI